MAVLTLSVPPALEERLVDWLLEHDSYGFSSSITFRHRSEPGERWSVAEQVAARQKRVEFRIELPVAAVDEVLGGLGAEMRHADSTYFVTPLLRSGRLGGSE